MSKPVLFWPKLFEGWVWTESAHETSEHRYNDHGDGATGYGGDGYGDGYDGWDGDGKNMRT